MSKSCFGCSSDLPNGALFCPKCGRDVRPKARRNTAGGPSQEAVQDYKYIRQVISETTKSFNNKWLKLLLTCGVVSAVAYYFPFYFPYRDDVATCAGAAAVLGLFGFKSADRWLSSAEYYSIRGSSRNGKHCCIKCGNPGIYYGGEYKSNAKYAYCSKCRFSLFEC